IHVVSGGWNSKPPARTVAGQYDAYHEFGMSVVAVCHRTIDDGVSWPAPADDLIRAIQFIRLHAADWNIDPDRISIAGRSSGGHVAMMVAFGEDRADPSSPDPVCRQSSAVRCVIQQGGPTNLSVHIRALLDDEEFVARRGDYIRSRVQALLGITLDDVGAAEFYRRLSEISPINLVNRNTVPVLMLYTGPEGVTSIDDPRLKWNVHTPISGLTLAAKLEQLGVDHEIVIGQNLGRGSARSVKAQKAFLIRHNNIP
ncbi:MAG: alpha/beta hydrolase fold domain-containing protein, partial [Planctomycetaceae bacterium]